MDFSSVFKHWQELLFKNLVLLSALLIGGILLAIFIALFMASVPTFEKFSLGFITGTNWDPVAEDFGALPFIYGTIVASIIALLFAVPLSLGIAVFLAELAPSWLRGPVSYAIELLAAIPSIIYGIWGLFVLGPIFQSYIEPWLSTTLGFLPFFKGTPLGVGMLLGGIILGVMIIPTIASISRDVLLQVPMAQKEGAYALGMTRWETIWNVVFPYAKSGILGAVILGFGRAMGETMAITMVIGNSPAISASLFDPAYTIAAAIANEFAEATGKLHLSALIELGFILLVITLIFNGIAKFLIWSLSYKGVVRE